MNVVSVVVAALKSNAAITRGMVGKMEVDIMLDSGSSVSLIQEGVVTDFLGEKTPSPVGLTLVSAAGEDIPVLGCITVPLGIGSLQVSHSLIIVQSLIGPVILGLDFLQKHRNMISTSHIVIDQKIAMQMHFLDKGSKVIVILQQ